MGRPATQCSRSRFSGALGRKRRDPSNAWRYKLQQPEDCQHGRTCFEAHLAEAARDLERVATMPLLITGGVNSIKTLASVLESSDKALARVGTGFRLIPDLANSWARSEDPKPNLASS